MNLQIDSRNVEPGDIFFCLEGTSQDGHDFAEAAKANGAAVIVYSHEIPFSEEGGTLYIKVEDTLKALNEAASSFYGFPSDKLTMFGVTGTNGKSSISYMISEIYSKYQGPCGYMGTIGGRLAPKEQDSLKNKNKGNKDNIKEYSVNLTTPSVIDMHRILGDMLDNGATAAAIEVSAQGVIQGRVDAVDFDFAIYTNLTREHLDYFGHMENYFEAKAKFFKIIRPETIAVINIDDEYGPRILDICVGTPVTYGIEEGNAVMMDITPDYLAVNINHLRSGMEFDIQHEEELFHVVTDMQVIYNLYNLLAVFACLYEAGLDPDDILKEFKHVPSIPGRMTTIDEGQDFKVIVDYAHTDDSYEQLLKYAREDMPDVNRIITVNGAPGKRDKRNRESYGKWIGMYGDHAILTEEDPRDETVEGIAKEIASHLPKGFSYEIIPDREEAIKKAINMAEPGDVILILGKGAENYQARQNGKEFWMGDDEAARKVLKELK